MLFHVPTTASSIFCRSYPVEAVAEEEGEAVMIPRGVFDRLDKRLQARASRA